MNSFLKFILLVLVSLSNNAYAYEYYSAINFQDSGVYSHQTPVLILCESENCDEIGIISYNYGFDPYFKK